MNQDQKHDYLSRLYNAIGKEDDFGQCPMAGGLYLTHVKAHPAIEDVYCSPGCAQYFGGEDFPADDDVMIGFSILDHDGNDTDQELHFMLTYEFETDLSRYLSIIRDWRAQNSL